MSIAMNKPKPSVCTACLLWMRTRGVRCIEHTPWHQRRARAKAVGVVR